MKKRLCVVITLLSVFLFTICTPVMAESSSSSKKSLKDLEVNYESMSGHEGRTHDQLVKELLNDGLSQEDAEYYADVDILTNQIELQNINIEDDLKDVQKLSDQYARTNPDELRQKALNKDPSALKTLLSQNEAIFSGSKDTQQVVEQAVKKEKKDNKGYKVTVEYPDGSKYILLANTVKIEESSSVKPNTFVSGPWNSSDWFDYDAIWTPGSYTTTTTWQYQSGTSIAKVSDQFKWTYATSPSQKTTYVSDTGSSSYAGTVTIGTEYLSNHANTTATSQSQFIQGYTDVRFQVSQSFSANFQGIISISTSSGSGWHEYAVSEVSGVADIYYWCAQFK